MIALGRDGRTKRGFDAFVERAVQALTTPVGARPKRRLFGSFLHRLKGRNMSPGLLAEAQALAILAFYNPANGLTDFVPKKVVASAPVPGRLVLSVYGDGWQFEVSI